MLTGIIDYAGLFPPAKLPLDHAIRDYARYRREPEAWMLGRFICPAARLLELTAFPKDLFQSGPPIVFSAVGRDTNSVEEFLNGLQADLQAIAGFRDNLKSRVDVDVLEVRLPPDLVQSPLPVTVDHPFVRAAKHITELGPPALSLFFEAGRTPDYRQSLGELIDALSNYHQFFGKAGSAKMGLKLRCGGIEALAFPDPHLVAFVVAACRDADVPLKFTAGLHHPVRHFDAALPTKMHGFLNLFGAGILAHARRLKEAALLGIIEDENPDHFVFENERFRWKEFSVSEPEIVAARRRGVISFGSCSFAEPRDDLRALGLL
jgi:hypothetical protein